MSPSRTITRRAITVKLALKRWAEVLSPFGTAKMAHPFPRGAALTGEIRTSEAKLLCNPRWSFSDTSDSVSHDGTDVISQ